LEFFENFLRKEKRHRHYFRQECGLNPHEAGRYQLDIKAGKLSDEL
jgi:hypothetical protein